MTLSQRALVGLGALALVCLPVLPVLPVLAAGAGQQSYEVDLGVASELWPQPPPIESVDELFRLLIVHGEERYPADTHLYGESIRVIPYHDADQVTDAAGRSVARGDDILAVEFPPGEVGLAVRHNRISYRRIDLDGSAWPLEQELGLRDTHLEILVGVERAGAPGVVTLNSPQTYERGRFGDADYPMIFLRPRLSSEIDEKRRLAFRDNLRTWVTVYDAVLAFPTSFRADHLAASDLKKVQMHAEMAVRAIAGQEAALEWFHQRKQRLYCSELAYLALNTAVTMPLNASTFVPIVGDEVWSEFEAELDRHNAGEPSRLKKLNKNAYAALVRVRTAPEDLEPIAVPELAIEPLTLPDLIELSLLSLLPRERWGAGVAPAQAKLLDRTRRRVLSSIGIKDYEEPSVQPILELYDRIVEVVAQPEEDYRVFRERLDPLLDEIRTRVCERESGRLCYYAPPAMFHWAAIGMWPSPVWDFEYVGHGMHYSAVRSSP